ncbi:MAG: C39 family peptidase [Alphaproteobacteria bacterium]|nr:C39 family peptidase [Alphaproteobacteria bacterium]
MDSVALAEVMGNERGVDYSALLPAMEMAMLSADVTTPLRAAMWMAQIGHESQGLKYMEEIASGAAYEWRSDLGNVYAGDGPRYKGSGPIQLTGRANFRAFTQWARSKGLTTLDFEAEPERVRQDPKWGFLAATYFWVNRPKLNQYADQKDLLRASALINGWYDDGTGKPREANGYKDRLARYNKALSMGARIVPGGNFVVKEKTLEYSRNQITQDTFYNCGPAATQTVIQARTGEFIQEVDLGRELLTDQDGTDYIGQFPAVLNKHIGGDYIHVDTPNYLNDEQKEKFWNDIVGSIDAGYGVIVNIVAPPTNYPKAVPPSTISPKYSGGTVYHYIAVMGYLDDGARKVWVADSGFSPYGYHASLDQLASLMVPKGYAYSTIQTKEDDMAFTEEDRALLKRVHHELTHQFGSRYPESTYRETLVGYILELDRKVEDMHSNMLPKIGKLIEGLFKKDGK